LDKAEADMPLENQSYLTQAAEYWAKGESLEAGKLIYDRIPTKARPKWAASILRLVLDRSGIQSSLFSEVLAMADNENMWESGHRVFDKLRDRTLQLNELRRGSGLTEDEELLLSVMSLAELVAKVIYNATNTPDEFDEDSGWWIAVCLKAFTDRKWTDEEFTAAAWSALCSCE
jgi:hypothetical protein